MRRLVLALLLVLPLLVAAPAQANVGGIRCYAHSASTVPTHHYSEWYFGYTHNSRVTVGYYKCYDPSGPDWVRPYVGIDTNTYARGICTPWGGWLRGHQITLRFFDSRGNTQVKSFYVKCQGQGHSYRKVYWSSRSTKRFFVGRYFPWVNITTRADYLSHTDATKTSRVRLP